MDKLTIKSGLAPLELVAALLERSLLPCYEVTVDHAGGRLVVACPQGGGVELSVKPLVPTGSGN